MKILCLSLLFAASLIAIDDFTNQLEVKEISFEGNKMLLSGDFKWEHPLGKIQAKSAEATFDHAQNSRLPSEITMQEGVEIGMQDGGVLTSPYAWLGCRQWVGVFHGHEQKKTAYENSSEGLSLKSLRMEMNFVPPSGGRIVMLERLTADGSVEIGVDPDIKMTADRALFDQFSSKGAFGKAFLVSEGAPCTMTQSLPDNLFNKICAAHVELDVRTKLAILDSPEGELQRDGAPLRFKSKKMIVNQAEERITLEPPVTIDWLGILEASGIVEITQKNKQMRSVFVQGPAIISWKERRLEVFGTLSIDPIDKKIFITSPEDHNGIVLEKEQIFFSDSSGKIYADRGQVTFQDIEGQLKPLKMILEGNVRLQNDTPGSLQYALADEATFDFGNNTLALQSKKRLRVLFFDELNKIQASAPALVINRDPKTGQDVMRGIGNVRFVFAEDELVELKKRFSFVPKK